MKRRLPAALEKSWREAAVAWRESDSTRRLFERDAALWTGGGEDRWLGWLDAPAVSRAHLARWRDCQRDAAADGVEQVLVLGMGGSSLAPEVQRAAVPGRAGAPRVTVLDSIHPDAIARCEAALDLRRTAVIVASKSGSTLEPNILFAHFWAAIERALGGASVGRRFLAITDPESKLEHLARERGFRRIVLGEPTIGGRFSALSPFGVVPAALQGIDLDTWLGRAETMSALCRRDEAEGNPGVALGLALAVAAKAGHDKLTLVAAEELALLGAWLEQLIAESTGKLGKGIVPIDGEPLGAPSAYGTDRLFVGLRLGGRLADGDDAKLSALADAGHPVLELELADALDLGAEFYRWEIATAVAGAVLGLDPFDQPDVEAAKLEARALAKEVEKSGSLPPETPFFEGALGRWLAPEAQARVVLAGAGAEPDDGALLRAHLRRLQPGDYFALLAFVDPCPDCVEAAQRMRRAVRDSLRVASSVGFGPRYLHSTGQAHKGGPPSGLFLVVADRPERDLPIPGQRLSFGQAIAAQARGDFQVLAARGRRALRLELGGSGRERMPQLADAVEAALAWR
jgi:transaldolase/glucose-6-phosphate isomerase